MRRTTLRLLAPAVLAAAGVFATSDLNQPLTAQTTTPVVVASGLDNPRGLAFGPNGLLYVVEAGRGGTSALCLPGIDAGPPRCYGPTGSVTQVAPNGQLRVLTGLPSVAGPTGNGATGPHDIDFGFNSAWITIGLGTDPANRAPFEAAGIGPDGAAYVLEHDADSLLSPGTVGRLTKIGLFG